MGFRVRRNQLNTLYRTSIYPLVSQNMITKSSWCFLFKCKQNSHMQKLCEINLKLNTKMNNVIPKYLIYFQIQT